VLPQFLETRLFPFRAAARVEAARFAARRVLAILAEFRPDAILTVTDYGLWAAAAEAARRLDVPLHLVLHDDLPSKATSNSSRPWQCVTRALLRRRLGCVYRQAASRFCVSPGMAEAYEAQFRRPATVLYPSRGEDSPEPRVRVRSPAIGGPVLAFAGALYTSGAQGLLRHVAELLEDVRGELHLYTRADRTEIGRAGLDRPNVKLQGFFPPQEMAERMAETAHALFLPASFLQRERTDVSTLFPSKLADYTAVGLPILAWGPPYSSSSRWFSENPGASELVTEFDLSAVRRAIHRLAADPAHAAARAVAAISAGNRYFAPDMARGTFLSELQRVAAQVARR
jgi:hypothetical protein